ncbi:hypothetical protein [Pseudophaeobacter sp.]|uniref:hypothetical protein n=1 Tax=Pseudophaeobacter sp. TaxID=1971739 RepID=UPI0040587476
MLGQSNISILVTIHDQDLLLAYEAERKFAKQAVPTTYVFVGQGPTDKISHLENVVVARDLPDNIETHKYLVDFTSWYACVRNGIATGENVCLIQYDVSLAGDFASQSLAALERSPASVVGYSPVAMKDRNFIRDNMGYAPLRAACKAVYGLDIGPLLKTHMKLAEDKFWPATNNVAMQRKTLEDFVRWFTPLAMYMGNEKPVGHAFERAIKLFCVLTGRSNLYEPNVLSHFQMNSHETQDFEKDAGRLHKLLARNIREQD